MSAAALSVLILAVCIVLFVTEWIPLVTTAILGCTAMVAFNVCTFADGFAGFASSTVFLVIGMVTLGNAMFETGAAQLMGNSIIKLAGDNERVLIAVCMTVAAVLSAFLSNTATVAMFIAILSGLVASNKHLKLKNMLFPVGLAAVAGGACTLVGSTPQVAAQGILEKQLGAGFKMFDFAPVGAPIVVAMILFCVFVAYPMGKKMWAKDEDKLEEAADVAAASSEGSEPRNMTKIYIVMVIFILTIAGFVLEVFESIGTTCMVSALLCVLTGCISQKKVIAGMDWVTIGVLGGALGIAQGLAVSGGGKLIADAFINMVGTNASPFIIFAALVLICMVLTQFMSNTACIAMLLPIALFICADMGYSPYAFAMGLIFAANMSFSTPLATAPLTMCLTAGYSFMDYVKIGGGFNVVCYFLVIFLVPLFFPLVI